MFWKVLNTLVARESSLLTNVSLKSLLARNLTTVAFGQSDLIDKWKSRFEEEKVPEVDASLENILEHVLDKDKDKVGNGHGRSMRMILSELCITNILNLLIVVLLQIAGQSRNKNHYATDQIAVAAIRGIVRMSYGTNAYTVHHWRMGIP